MGRRRVIAIYPAGQWPPYKFTAVAQQFSANSIIQEFFQLNLLIFINKGRDYGMDQAKIFFWLWYLLIDREYTSVPLYHNT